MCTTCSVPFEDGQYYEVDGNPYCSHDYWDKFGQRCAGMPLGIVVQLALLFCLGSCFLCYVLVDVPACLLVDCRTAHVDNPALATTDNVIPFPPSPPPPITDYQATHTLFPSSVAFVRFSGVVFGCWELAQVLHFSLQFSV